MFSSPLLTVPSAYAGNVSRDLLPCSHHLAVRQGTVALFVCMLSCETMNTALLLAVSAFPVVNISPCLLNPFQCVCKNLGCWPTCHVSSNVSTIININVDFPFTSYLEAILPSGRTGISKEFHKSLKLQLSLGYFPRISVICILCGFNYKYGQPINFCINKVSFFPLHYTIYTIHTCMAQFI